MRKKSIISTILFLAIAFIGCQKNNIQQSKNYENKSDVKIVKREKLKKCTKTEFSEREEVVNMSFIEIKGLSKIFLQGNQKIYGIRNVNISIERGTFMSVIGRSGSGKSTFLNLVGGIENPTSGEVFFDGKSIHQFKDKELTKFRNQHIGYVFQQYHLLKELTVLENIRLPLDIGRKAYDHSYEEELLDLLGLKDRTDFYPSQLSGGQQQRVAIARALITRPDLILADEPTGNLDKQSGDQIIRFMKETNRLFGQTYIIVTHNKEIADYTDREITIDDGEIINDIDLLDVRENEVIK